MTRRVLGPAVLVLILLTGSTLVALSSAAKGPASPSAASVSPDPSSERAARAAIQRSRDRQAARKTPRRVERQVASRRRHQGLPPEQSAGLAKRTFSIGRLAWQRPEKLDGGTVKHYVGDHALVQELEGRRTLVGSTVPLRVADAAGRRHATSLELVRDGAAFAPEHPVVPVRFAAGARISVGDEIIAAPVPASGSEVGAPALAGEAAFYGDVGPDTDFIVKPVPAGAEAFWQLRSIDSPVEQRLRLELPQGAVLRPVKDAPGAAEVVRGGKRMLLVPAPAAVDAAGEPVAVSMSVRDGNTLALRVAPDEHAEYPLLVDPVLDATYGNFGSGVWTGWSTFPSQPTPWEHRSSSNLLQVLADPAKGTFDIGKHGGWKAVQRGDAGIQRVDLWTVGHKPPDESFLLTGLYRSDGSYQGTYSVNGYWGNTGDAPYKNATEFFNQSLAFCAASGGGSDHGEATAPLCDANASAYGFGFSMQIQASLGSENNVQMGGAALKYLDNNPPSSATVTLPAGWVTSASIPVKGTDGGVGVRRFGLRAGGVDQEPQEATCNQLRWFCPPTDTKYFSGAGLPDGSTPVSASVEDAVDNSTPATGSGRLKLDRVDPKTPTLGGKLWTGRNAPITDDAPSATVTVADGPTGNPASSANSGIATTTLKVGSTSHPRLADCYGEDNCAVSGASHAPAIPDGEHTLSMEVRDRVNHLTTKPDTAAGEVPWEVTIDRTPPELTAEPVHTPSLGNGEWQKPVKRSVGLSAKNDGTGVAQFRVTTPNGSSTEPVACSGATSCPTPASKTVSYSAPEGVATVAGTALDPLGRPASNPKTWTVKTDGSKPTLSLSTGSPAPVVVNDYVSAITDDGSSGVARAGIERIRWSDNGRPQPDITVDCTGGCPRAPDAIRIPIGPQTASEGLHTIVAESVDAAGNVSDPDTAVVYVASAGAVDRSKLGLESYFGYETTPTGAQTQARVNVDTGNVVWSAQPIVNAGRGLATVVNLTYNSLDRGGYLGSLISRDVGNATPLYGQALNDLVGTAYGEAGIGFSLGISGVTRLNEPLGGMAIPVELGISYPRTPPEITLTDADGTRHVFRLDPDHPDVYREPPGVNLKLRRYSDTESRRWVMTRPDGVRFFFDSQGYQRSISDRNGNVIRFDYERYSKLTGRVADCLDAPATGVDEHLCTPRVYRVVDPHGVSFSSATESRSLRISYYEDTEVLPLGDGSSSPFLQGPVGVRPGRIKRIVDHGGRATDFTYDEDGYLETLTQGIKLEPDLPDDRSKARTLRFGYTGSAQNRQLSSVKDPLATADSSRRATTFEYESPVQPGPVGTFSVGMRVRKVTNRAGNPTAYTPRTSGYLVTAPGNRDTTFTVDDTGKPKSVLDGRGVETRMTWDDDNNLDSLTEAANKPAAEQAETRWRYNRSGQLVEIIDPNNRKTELSYCYGVETRTDEPPECLAADDTQSPGASGVADTTAYVADLIRIKKPKGNALTLGLDKRGNVTSEQYDGKAAAIAHYDGYGRVDWRTDEVGNTTRYSTFDANGLPQRTVDPRGTDTSDPDDPSSGVWLATYDAVGNVRSMTDPRGTTAGPDNPYTTSWSYDVFDRVTSEKVPRMSGATLTDFVTRTTDYDANDNPKTQTNGKSEAITRTFTAMDRLRTEQTELIAHVMSTPTADDPDSTTITSERETTRYSYDARENLVAVEAPLGTRSATVDDRTTRFEYDAADQRVISRRMARGTNLSKDLVTSYAYDARGNLVGVADPKRNGSGDPLVNATTPATQRWQYGYDKAGNRTSQIEDPGKLALKTTWQIDPNNNVEYEFRPRFYAAVDRTGYAYSNFIYDTRDEVVDRYDGISRRTHYERRDDGKVSEVVSPRGMFSAEPEDYKTKLEYDPNGDLKTVTLPSAKLPYDNATLTVRYKRNPVGDPEQITDPRGRTVTNSFYATGELAKTSRPSIWDAAPQPDEAGGGAEVTLKPYEEWSQPGEQAALPETEGHGDFGAVPAEGLPGLLPAAGETTFSYDEEMRLASVTDVESKATTLGRDAIGRVNAITRPFSSTQNIVTRLYVDPNGNPRRAVDGLGQYTTTTYDQFDRPVREIAPGHARTIDGPDVKNITGVTYDDNDNPIVEDTAVEGASYKMSYDSADRLVSRVDPEGDNTTYGYDAAGNQTCQRSPRGDAAGTADDLTCEPGPYTTERDYTRYDQLMTETRTPDTGDPIVTSRTYDLDGNETRIVEPGAKRFPEDAGPRNFQTDRIFDGRDRPYSETTYSGSTVRTTVTEHDANGNLQRIVNPLGVADTTGARFPKRPFETEPGQSVPTAAANQDATVLAYNDDNLLTDRWLPRDAGEGAAIRQQFRRDTRGRVERIEAPSKGDEPTTRMVYRRYETGWINRAQDFNVADAAAPTPDTAKATFNYAFDRQGNQLRWSTGQRSTDRAYYPNGQLRMRTASEGVAGSTRTYDYAYNGNGTLTEMRDRNPGRRDPSEASDSAHTTTIGVDKAERPLTIDETWVRGKDTTLTYDADGNVRTRKTDGAVNGTSYTGGKTTTFDYDSIGRERWMLVQQAGEARQHERVVTTQWWPSGAKQSRTKAKQNQDVALPPVESSTESWFYNTDGAVRQHRRKRRDATDYVKDQVYTYDKNGNRATDERGSYSFNGRDQLVRWTKKRNNKVVNYRLDSNGAMDRINDAGSLTVFESEHDRLRFAKTYKDVAGGAMEPNGASLLLTAQYDTDSATGNVKAITYSTPDGAEPPPKVDYDYDGFGRLVEQTSGGKETHIGYDALDRRDWRCVGSQKGDPNCTGASSNADYGYVGLSEQLSVERDTENKHRTYDYDSALERLGQDRFSRNANNTLGSISFKSFVTDANGTVEGLEDKDGNVAGADAATGRESYDYDPYGGALNSATGDSKTAEEGLSEDAKNNPFRFQGHRYDANVGTYDMLARAYRPESGRFLSEDRFESAAGDFALQLDPMTSHRYAFVNGNPIDRVETDGHEPEGSYNRNARRPMRDEKGKCYTGCKAPSGNDESNEGPDPYYQRGNPNHERMPAASPSQNVNNDRLSEANWRRSPTAYACQACPSPAQRRRDKVELRKGAKRLRTLARIGYEIVSLAPPVRGGRIAKELAEEGVEQLRKRWWKKKVRDRGNDGPGRRVPDCGALRSFSAGTRVLMRDGTAKPISQVRVGDMVLAADPITGVRGARKVLAVWVHDDTLVDLPVGRGVITTTEDHPFWNATDGQWQDVALFDRGDDALTADGDRVEVGRFRAGSAHVAPAYNLTVEGLHTYFVASGGEFVLVHNTEYSLGSGFEARLDRFNVKGGQADFEIHVYKRGRELGIFGSDGWFSKHQKSADVKVPGWVDDRLKGIAVDEMRRSGRLPDKGQGNVKGDNWKRPRIAKRDC